MKLIAPVAFSQILPLVFVIVTLLYGPAIAEKILEDYKYFEIIPDVLNKAPNALLKVYYNNNEFQFGKELTPAQVQDAPVIEWNFDPSSFYALIMNEPDAPSRRDRKLGECLHWLVVNIPGDKFSGGENLVEYMGSGAPKDSGLHRYLFSVYKQPDKLIFSEKPISNISLEGRLWFNLQNFAAKYNLDGPIAGNMFQAQYDDYVPEFYKKIGVDLR